MNSLDANHELLLAARAALDELDRDDSVTRFARLRAAVTHFDPPKPVNYAPVVHDMNARLAKVRGETQDDLEVKALDWQSEH